MLDVLPGPTLLETRITALVDDRRIRFSLADVADENGNAQIGWDLWLERFWKSRCDGRARAGARRRQLRPPFGALSEEGERLVKLSRRMARKNTKRSTLDYLPRADWNRWRISPPAAAAPAPNAQLDRFAEAEFDHV